MNKLFTKISKITIGLALLVGAGVSIFSNTKKATNVNAEVNAVANIVSGHDYYIKGVRTDGTVEYLTFNDTIGDNVVGTSADSIENAQRIKFIQEDSSWYLKTCDGHYLLPSTGSSKSRLKITDTKTAVEILDAKQNINVDAPSGFISISYEGMYIQKAKSSVNFGCYGNTQNNITLVEAGVIKGGTATFDFTTNNGQFIVATSSELTIISDDQAIIITHTKVGGADANIYYPGSGQATTRFYTKNTVTISSADGVFRQLGTITFTALTDNMANTFANATWSGATAAAVNNIVTITPSENVSTVSCVLGGYCGFTEATAVWNRVFNGTHSKVLSTSQLTNGSKVLLAANDGESNLVATPHIGGNNLSTAIGWFDRDNDELEPTSVMEEFTVWEVDNHFVFSDGGYYLAASTEKNDYLQRTDILSERCYFDIVDGAGGVVITSPYTLNYDGVSSAYIVQLDTTNDVISLFGTEKTPVTLYVSKETVSLLDGFVTVFMHFENVSELDESDTNACRDSGEGAKGYFTAAMNAFNDDLLDEDREDFVTNYADAFARLDWWAKANKYTFDSDHLKLIKSSSPSITSLGKIDETRTVTVIVFISMISLSGIVGYFFLRRRKEQ